TKGGVVANENSEVLDKNKKVIKGLYAAGEVVSTSGAYSSSVVFGRLAGEKAAEFTQKLK
ncbi:MAG: FAD-binding protein, partial [Fusobacteriaceae bacterium]